MPDALKRRPRISKWLLPYLSAYQRLDRRRQMGYSTPQPLASSEILDYGTRLGFRTDLDFFFRVIDALDGVYMEDVNKKQQAEAAKSKAKSKAKSGNRRGRRR